MILFFLNFTSILNIDLTMSEASTVLSITKFVDNFINENGSENVINIWNEEARESFLKIFKKEIKKNGGASKKKI